MEHRPLIKKALWATEHISKTLLTHTPQGPIRIINSEFKSLTSLAFASTQEDELRWQQSVNSFQAGWATSRAKGFHESSPPEKGNRGPHNN